MSDSNTWDELSDDFTEDSLFGELLRRVAGSDETDAASIAQSFEGHPRFRLIEPLGRGGFGAVYRAFDRRLEVEVALKVLHRGSPSALYRFKQEFRRVQGLVHPRLVRLHELYAEDLGWFLTMDLIPGEDWGDRFPPKAPPPRGDASPQLMALLPQLLDGIEALHGVGILHRDLKPGNVRVTPEGQVVILDFGLATSQAQEEPEDISGTPAYMAPELKEGVPPSPASDLFAVGLMIYESLMGTRAGADTLAKGPRLPLGSQPAEALKSVSQSLLARDPTARPTIPEMRQALGLRDLTGPKLSPLEHSPLLKARGERVDTALPPPLTLALRASWTKSQGGAPQMLLLEGVEHGQGELFLRGCAQEILDITPEALWLKGACRLQESLPFRAFDGVLDHLVQALLNMEPALRRAILPLDMTALAHVFPSFKALGGRGIAPRGGLSAVRLRAVAALRGLLVRLGQDVPIVITIEDIHWSDGDSALPMIALLNSPSPIPLLIVATSRGGLGEIGERIDDAQLWGGAGGALQRLFLGSAAGPMGGEEGDASAPIDALQSLEGVPSGGVELLIALSLVEEPLERPLALRSAGGGADSAVVDGLVARGLVAHAGGDRLRLAPGIREILKAAEGELGQRPEVAQALVDALERMDVPSPRRVSEIWCRVGETRRGVEVLRAGAEAAKSKGALEEAASLYALASERLGGESAQDIEARATCLGMAGRSATAARLFHGLGEGGEPGLRPRHLGLAAEQYIAAGLVSQGLEVTEVALAAGGFPPLRGGKWGVARIAFGQLFLGRAIDRFKPSPPGSFDPEALEFLDVSWSLGLSLMAIDPIFGYQVFSGNLRMALRVGEPARVARALYFRAFLMEMSGAQEAKVQRLLKQAEAYGAGIDHAPGGEARWMFLAISKSMGGDFEGAIGEGERALQALETSPGKTTHALGVIQGLKQSNLYWLGRLQELRDQWNSNADLHRLRGDRYGLSHVTSQFGWLGALLEDAPEQALRQVEQAEAGWEGSLMNMQTFTLLMARCNIYFYENTPHRALEMLEEQGPALLKSGVLRLKVNRWRHQLLLARAQAAVLELQKGLPQKELKARVSRGRRLLKGILKEVPPWIQGTVFIVDARFRFLLGEREEAMASMVEGIELLRAASVVGLLRGGEWRLGGWMGGDEGRALVEGALGYFAGEGAKAPEKMARMIG